MTTNGLVALVGLSLIGAGLACWLGWPAGLVALGAGLFLDAQIAPRRRKR